MRRKLSAALLFALIAPGAAAFEPFVVKDIRVEGIQRTEAGTVFNYLPVRVGETMNDEKAAQAIKALFATGFFKDVRIEIEGGVLVVIVAERPAIAQIDFVGVKEFDKDALKKGLKEVGLAEARIFDRSLLDKAEQELKRQYLSRGRYAVNVTTTVTPLERNRVSLNFTVDEGEVAKIREINIVGARAFKEKDLLGLFSLTTPGWLTWYTKNDQYSRQKLSGDLESLRSHYLDRGYLEFNIDSTQVSITPDKRDIYITINVTEGEKYTVSSVRLGGELLLAEDELKALVKMKPGDVFSRRTLTETTKAISERLGNDGYAFANVNAQPEIDKEKRQVAFTILLDPGRRVYVRRVNVAGNSRTRDEVIRREMRQMEGAWYDGALINKSRTRIDRLGYFDEVTVETPPVPQTTDQVDLNVAVKEKATGNLMLGAGLSSSEKLVLSGSISQNNIFGTGKSLTAQLSGGKINQVYSLSFTEPYYTLDGVALGYDIYHRNVDPTSLTVGRFNTSSDGGGIRLGLPVSDDDFVNVGLSADRTTIKVFDDSPQRYKDFVGTFGGSTTTLLSTAGWSRDKRDSLIYPTSGSLQRLSGELSLPGGELRFYRASYQHQRFFPIGRDYALMLNGEVGIGNGYNGKPLPFFKNYFAGGIGSVRGFDTASLGPRDVLAGGGISEDALGGNRKVVLNGEFLFPFPGSGKDRSLRLGAFVDAGQVWAQGQKASFGDLRYAAGLSLAWSSPVGPLKLSIAQPINEKEGDRVQRFQFQLGTTF
ncbi:MAG TPA: outer membrane protein assembly factor BamA [Rhodocyclaceae bacterium]|nr:MAG: outer membrane protein assembly factor BamA [Betaproteobacteria bacterium CG2_30_68_42]PIX74457.1 MAG: outer membrane protein assembly factor BamA [Rhodocyclales bacterium CG_4_10_14_3_um_filter_68_10]PJA56512.1 MAG: outer membrane protein assembly factor BamA [Rhodocyclales bacterium CG_4_9_14_3_um_filter_68_10]HCX33760.1 outer membrane protein assembly factor BamA [Rhodocyclaceae bacterium]